MMNNQALSLMEILAIIIVVGILAAIALPNFAPMRESVLDKESNASLKLIQAAQKIYKLETGFYYPVSGTIANNTDINTALRISLPPVTVADRKWNYRCTYTGGVTSCADSTRTTAGGGDTNKKWHLQINETDQTTGLCP